MQPTRTRMCRAAVTLTTLVPALALAHDGHSLSAVGFAAGIAHPWSGIDHVAAFALAGAWALARGGRARWLAPLAFAALTALGSTIAPAAATVPLIEALAAFSVIALGALVWLRSRVTGTLAGTVLCAFALVHGQAHATAAGAQPEAFAAGLALSTLALQFVGMSIAAAVRRLIHHGDTLMSARILAFSLAVLLASAAGTARAADAKAGEQIVGAQCADCHEQSEFASEDAGALAAKLKDVVAGKVKHKKKLTLTDAQIADIAAYLASGSK